MKDTYKIGGGKSSPKHCDILHKDRQTYLMIGKYQSICYYNVLSSTSSKHYYLSNVIRSKRFAATWTESACLFRAMSVEDLRINSVCLGFVAVEAYN